MIDRRVIVAYLVGMVIAAVLAVALIEAAHIHDSATAFLIGVGFGCTTPWIGVWWVLR